MGVEIESNIKHASAIYKKAFNRFQRGVLDGNPVKTILRISMLMNNGYPPKDVEVAMEEAVQIYSRSFGATSWLDEDSIGNIITIAEFLLAKKAQK